VEVISHQAVCVNLPAGFLARLRQRFEKILPIHVVHENVLAPIAPIHEMVNGAGVLDAQLAWHTDEQKAVRS